MARACLIAMAIASLALTFTARAAAAPANDDFANAEALSGETDSASGTNAEATKETGEPNHAGNAGGASVWYEWEAPQDGVAYVDTCDSDFDTLLGVYTGSAVNALSEVTSNDDAYFCGTRSAVSFDAHAGTTYRIAVDGYEGATGAVELWVELEVPPPPPANDDFANAEALSGETDSASGTNASATKEAGEPNHAGNPGGASVWYEWEAPQDGAAYVDTCDSDFDTLLGVYTGSAVNALSEVTSNDDYCGNRSSVSFEAHAGTTYWIAVDGYDGATGALELWVELEEPEPESPAPTPTTPAPTSTPTAAPAPTSTEKSSSVSTKCRKARRRAKKAKKSVKKAKKGLEKTKKLGNKAKSKKATKRLKKAKKRLKRANKAKRKACAGQGASSPTSSPDAAPNQPPSFPPGAVTFTSANYLYSAGFLIGADIYLVAAAATDPDGDPLTYTWDATTGSINPSAENPRNATWRVPASVGRLFCGTATITASDGKGGSDTSSFKVTGDCI